MGESRVRLKGVAERGRRRSSGGGIGERREERRSLGRVLVRERREIGIGSRELVKRDEEAESTTRRRFLEEEIAKE